LDTKGSSVDRRAGPPDVAHHQLAPPARPTLHDLANEIRQEHEAFERNARSAIAHAVRVGELLLETKERLPHGGWGGWVRTSLPFGDRQAQKYMRLAEHAATLPNATSDSHFTIDRALRAIAAPRKDHAQPEPREEPRERGRPHTKGPATAGRPSIRRILDVGAEALSMSDEYLAAPLMRNELRAAVKGLERLERDLPPRLRELRDHCARQLADTPSDDPGGA
jgi:hypothetical protein